MSISVKFVTILFLIICSFAFGIIEPGRRAPDFTLKDADDKSYILSEMRDKIVVLLIGTQKSRKEGDKWIFAIEEDYGQYKDIECYLIADLRGLPFFVTESMVKWGVRREDLPFKTLLDWDGNTAQKYEVQRGLPNLFIIDKQGKIAYSYSGKYSDEVYSKFKKKLNLMLLSNKSKQYREFFTTFKSIILNIILYTFEFALIKA